MRINRFVSVFLLSVVTLSCTVSLAQANPGHGQRHQDRRAARQHREPGYVLDNRHHHNRYYPPRGMAYKSIPRQHYVIPYRNSRYYFSGGIWYQPFRDHFSIITPPIGIVVPVLPPFYTTVWVGGLPYYYADGVYYRWRPEERAYIVTNPPPESEVVEPSTLPEQLFAYPQKGQSEEQEADDRYECHRWAVEQTGFDPTQPGGNVPPEQNGAKRADYKRAMKSCLEAHGYSVR